MSFTFSPSLSPFSSIFIASSERRNLLSFKSSLHSSASASRPRTHRLSPDFTPKQLLRALRLQPDASSALRIFRWASKQPSFVPRWSVYEEMLRKLGKVGSFESMLCVLEEMKLAGSEIRRGTFLILVESYGRFEFYDEIVGVVEMMEVRFGLRPDRHFYNFVLSVLVDGNEIELARIAYSGMVSRGIKADVTTFRIVIKGLCRNRQIRPAILMMEEMVSHGLSPDKKAIRILMQSCVEDGYLDGIVRIRENLWKARWCHQSVMPTNVLVSTLLKTGRIGEARYMLKSEGMCEAGCVKHANEVMNAEKGFDPGIFTCKSLFQVESDIEVFDPIVSRNCKQNASENATKSRDILMDKDFMHDACELNSLIYDLCVIGNHGVATKLFVEMKNEGHRIDVCTYNILIDSLCSMRRFEDAMRLLKEMDLSGCARTVVTYNIMIKGFCKNMFVEEAEVIFRQMEVSRNLVTYNTLIEGLCKSMRITDAMNLMSQMTKDGLKPDKFTYNSLLTHFCRTGNVKKAADILRVMTSNGCEPDIVTYNTLIRGMCKASKVELDVAIRIIRTLAVKGMVITPHAYNPVIHELFKRNRRVEAMELFREMMEKGDPPNAMTFNIVFGGLCKGGGPIGDAIDFAVEMMGKGFVPQFPSFFTLAEGLCALSMEKTLAKLVTMLMDIAKLSDSEVSTIKGFLNTRKFRDGLLTLGTILDKHRNPNSAN